MAEMWRTEELQRSLLKILISGKITLSKYFNRVNPEWFDNSERRYIFGLISSHFKNSKNVLTDVIFMHDVNKSFGDKATDYISEWKVILKVDPIDTAEALMDLMSDTKLGAAVTDIIGKVMGKIESGEAKEAVRILQSEGINLSAKKEDDVPIMDIEDFEARKRLVIDKRDNPEKYAGIKTGFSNIDNQIGGLFPAELTMVVAITGVGKSTFLKALCYGVLTHIKNCLYVTNEENLVQVLHKFDALFTGMDYNAFKKGQLSAEQIKQWEDELNSSNKRGKLFVKEIPAHASTIDIEKAVLELQQRGHKIDVIFIDYIDQMGSTVKCWSEYDEHGKITCDVKNLSIMFNVPVVTATQAATRMEERQEKGKSFGKMDVYGSKRKVHASNVVIAVGITGTDPQSDPDPYKRDRFWKVDIIKNRDGSAFYFKAKHEVKTGRVHEVNSKGEKTNKIYEPVNVDACNDILNEFPNLPDLPEEIE